MTWSDRSVDLRFGRERGKMEMFKAEHSDRCRAEGDEVKDGGGERVELHAAGVRGLPWWLEWNDKKAGQYRHLAQIVIAETRHGIVTFVRAQRRVSACKEWISQLQTSLMLLGMSGSTLNEAALHPTKPFEWQSNPFQLIPLATWWLVCMRVWVCSCLWLGLRERAGGGGGGGWIVV